MIIDNIQNSHLYFGLGERITKALKFLVNTDFSTIESSRLEIDGSNIFAIVNNYETRPENESSWEAHRRYIDIHFMVKGTEQIGYANLDEMKISQDYNPEKDCLLLKGCGNMFILEPNTFAIFYPTDVHMPAVLIDTPKTIKKIVVKIKVN